MLETTRMQISIVEIPQGVLPAHIHVRNDQQKELVQIALNNNLKPELIDDTNLKKLMTYVPGWMRVKIQEATKDSGLSEQKAFTALAAAGAKFRMKQREEEIIAEKEKIYIHEAGKFATRQKLQFDYYNEMIVGLKDNKIVLAEASPGIGKRRAMMAAAIEQVREYGKRPVIVAAPTLADMAALYQEFFNLKENGVDLSDVKIVIRPGQSEFVDDLRLKEYLETTRESNAGKMPDHLQQTVEWVAKGGPMLSLCNDKLALASALRDLGLKTAWLMDDLRSISDGFPLETFCLDRYKESDSDSFRLLKEYTAAIDEHADIIICTHAMLAIAQKSMWKPSVLPKPDVIFIDEAHMFEQAVAQHNSTILSLFSLRWSLLRHRRTKNKGPGTTAHQASKLVNHLIDLCRDIKSENGQAARINSRAGSGYEPAAHARIRSELMKLNKMMRSRALKDLDTIEEYKSTLSCIEKTIKDTSEPLRVSLWPLSIVAGTIKLYEPLSSLWNATEGGVVLTSATLYLPEADDKRSCNYMRDALVLPIDRLYAPRPIVADYIYSLPHLYFPAIDKREALSAPQAKHTKDQGHKEQDWLNGVAQEIAAGPGENAVGGTLVLCTAYKQVDYLFRSLGDRGVDPSRIICQERGEQIENAKLRFVQAAREDKRPIMLAFGDAWTDFDLIDNNVKDPADDILLTDLVIVRVPLGLSRSLVIQDRFEQSGIYVINKEALLKLKQGLGHLVRRDGAQHRKVWFLDGRCWKPWQGMDNFTAEVRSMLGEYKHFSQF